MKNQEVSQRYASALYALAKENNRVEPILNELRAFHLSVEKDAEVNAFFNLPNVKSETQKMVLKKFFEKKNFSEEIQGLLVLLLDKRRFSLLSGIVTAYQSAVDNSAGVARGRVSSAATLFPEDRQKLEATISRYTHKKAVLEYHEDSSLLGGLVAQVGSYTFDDSLETQLRIMKGALQKRRSH